MVDKKVTEYTELIAVDYEDIAYIVDNPSGTPVSKKCTAQNLVKGGANEGACSALIDANLTASKNLVSDGSGKIATTDTEYVDKSGDTMTGNLTIEKTLASLYLNSDAGQASQIIFREGGSARGYFAYSASGNYIVYQNSIAGKALYMYDSGDVRLSTSFLPHTTQVYDLGSGFREWQDCYLLNAPTVSSDEKLKKDIQDIILGLDFINKLRPVNYKFKDIEKEAVTKEITAEVQKTELREVTETYVEIIDGKAIQKTKTKTVEIPLFDEMPLFDEQGNEIGTHKHPQMKTITKLEEIESAVNKTYKRNHNGLIAQEVKEVLDSIDIDSTIYCYDKEADRHMLRYEELIPCLIKAIQELNVKIDILESK